VFQRQLLISSSEFWVTNNLDLVDEGKQLRVSQSFVTEGLWRNRAIHQSRGDHEGNTVIRAFARSGPEAVLAFAKVHGALVDLDDNFFYLLGVN
jgi:hypothetical protein